jgi:peptidoglycan/LPS O-acetylase OafA/YrhL
MFVCVKKQFPADFIYNFLYLQNVLWVFTKYVSDIQPYFAHTWSLAIEEQFYLFWPLLIYIIPLKRVWLLCASVIVFAVVFRLWALYYFTDLEYLRTILLFSQSDILALGGLLACVKRGQVPKWIHGVYEYSFMIGAIGLMAVLLTMGQLNGDLLSGYPLTHLPQFYVNNPFTLQIFFFIGMISVGLIKKCLANQGLIHAIFSIKVLRDMGKISYGLYLYHWPVLVIVQRYFNNKLHVFIVAAIITVLVSVVSFRFFETWFNKLKLKISY